MIDNQDYLADLMFSLVGLMSFDVKKATAHLLLNRITHGGWADLADNLPRMFKREPHTSPSVTQSCLAAMMVAMKEEDPTKGATYMRVCTKSESWAKDERVIGGHIFIRGEDYA